MNILHIASHSGVYRGGAVQLCRMAAAQQARGHYVSIIPFLDREQSAEPRARDLATWTPAREAGIDILPIPYDSLAGFLRLAGLLRSRPFDIVHVHRDQALVAAWLALWGVGRTALVAQRGTVTDPPRWPARAFRSPRVRAVVAVAEAVRGRLIRKTRVPAEKIHVVYGSVDLEVFAPRPAKAGLREKAGIPEGARVIGSLSAYRKAKGFPDFLDALTRVLPERPDVHALFLGENVPEKVAPLARKLGVGDHCHFVGHQSNVADWLSMMDLTVVAARSREGLSGVLRESLAMEIPVVSTDCAGNREIVRDRETGLLVPIEDASAMAGALAWALDHPDAMKAMARAGRRWVERNCSLGAQAARLEEIYRDARRPAR